MSESEGQCRDRRKKGRIDVRRLPKLTVRSAEAQVEVSDPLSDHQSAGASPEAISTQQPWLDMTV